MTDTLRQQQLEAIIAKRNLGDLWADLRNDIRWSMEEAYQAGAASGQPSKETVVELARELYDRFVMGGWEPQDAYGEIERILASRSADEVERESELLEAAKEFLGRRPTKNDRAMYEACEQRLRLAVEQVEKARM